jgi:DNA helicase II / ATP-dependent DNA helicase PcrA
MIEIAKIGNMTLENYTKPIEYEEIELENDEKGEKADDLENTDNQILFKGLNPNQVKAVKSIEGETLVVAGAGSGKTAVLTRRCAYLILNGVKPGSILSLSFTNKAAKEMNDRIRLILSENGIDLPHNPPWVIDYETTPLFCTFHSLGVRILREFGEEINIRKDFNILDTDEVLKLIRESLKELNIDTKNLSPSYAAHFISLCKQELLTPKDSHKLEKEFLAPFHQVYKKYWDKCRENNVVDFDDLIILPYLILRDSNEIREVLKSRWLHIQIDEFQDTNTAQFELVYLLYPNL